ncbi:DNA-directed RNA polymerase subunit alpha C-terminal domain-containing protein [Noviherbaspirillum galbum]|uniref:RNA polymerase alpha subunit C-terminal domain-containing protein n=1 Tax=Noviherbaspirillum galbum TaxID=2709383 RepID=A0A6B3SNW6_9BURK|nr:DNA-directed RNA polymerase subunit alpha C-terminal domain-containing protein [Noviherbaspirillum galbum]NEX60152.1 hypothetical protein [Noviherbaspirillum galbum]
MEMHLIIKNDQDARKALDLLTEYLAKDWLSDRAQVPRQRMLGYDSKMALIDMPNPVPVRAHNLLVANEIYTLGELLAKTEVDLMRIDGFGPTCLEGVKIALEKMGLRLALSNTH